MSILDRFLGDPNDKQIKQYQRVVDQINELEKNFSSFSDDQIKEKTKGFREEIDGDTSKLDSILPEAFALVREAAKRKLNQRHYDVQLIGGMALHEGKIAEMKTGEGKTLASTTAIYLNALAGKGVHVVTVNDYLSRRDANWMGSVFDLLGMSVGCLNHEKAYLYQGEVNDDGSEVTIEMANLKEVSRKEAYAADITYGTNNEFGFDYLRDNMAPNLEMMVQREPHYAIIDEVDSILIDEARTPLIISMPDTESTKMYEQFSRIVPQLKENEDYNIDEKAKTVTLTEDGIAKVEKTLGMGNIYQEGGIRYVHHLEQALRARAMFKLDRDYVVKDGQVIIVDEFTGRLMPGRRYSEGLHQALEAKEGVQVQQESRTLASITFQNYFRMYPKVAGMTGTAITSAEEFEKVYKLEIVSVPTNKPLIRSDMPDVIYKTDKGKLLAIVKEIKERNIKGQPILVGTVSIEKNELLAAYLKKEGIAHQILNAKNHEQEAQIISQAGKYGAVTVATNMAGRGVDIILGGRDNPGDQKKVISAGGLHVIGTERHEARRIDDQLRGRSGRQGDPGSSQFFVSLEDDLMRIFGGNRVKGMMDMLKMPEDQPIENRMISRAIESAQAKIEGHNFDLRKHILEYDDVLNKQRETIYKKRKQALTKESVQDELWEMVEDEMRKIAAYHSQGPDVNYQEISEIAKAIFNYDIKDELTKFRNPESLADFLVAQAKQAYQEKEKEVEEKNMRQVEKYVLLRTIDSIWMNHIDDMSHLRDSVRLRAYGQKDPLVEYKTEGMKMFQKMLNTIQATVVNTIYKISLGPADSHGHQHNHDHGHSHEPQRVIPGKGKKVGRNDPCPCGSSKKYKKCCYPKYGK